MNDQQKQAISKSYNQYVSNIKAKLRAEGVDLYDIPNAVRVLERCCMPVVCVNTYLRCIINN